MYFKVNDTVKMADDINNARFSDHIGNDSSTAKEVRNELLLAVDTIAEMQEEIERIKKQIEEEREYINVTASEWSL